MSTYKYIYIYTGMCGFLKRKVVLFEGPHDNDDGIWDNSGRPPFLRDAHVDFLEGRLLKDYLSCKRAYREALATRSAEFHVGVS